MKSLEEKVKELQWKFHVLPNEDYCKETPRHKKLMKEYNALNKELGFAGYSSQKISQLYIEAEKEFEEADDNDFEYGLVIDQEKAEEIAKYL